VKHHTGGNGDNLLLAIAAILFSVFSLSLGDALIKNVSADFPLWQIFVIRSLIAIPVLIAIMRARYRSVSFMPIHTGWTALRSLMLTFMWVAYYTALPHIALSVAAAVFYTLPLFITMFAALFIGEQVGVRGWVAIFLGFCGVLLILRPQADDFNAYAMLPLISAILYALAMIMTRTKCRNESPLALSIGLNASFIIVGVCASVFLWAWGPSATDAETNPFLFSPWISLGAREYLAMVVLASAIIIGSVFAAFAYQSGPASTVSTFDFSYLAFAAFWGFLFFSEIPDLVTAGGILLIATSGILAVRR